MVSWCVGVVVLYQLNVTALTAAIFVCDSRLGAVGRERSSCADCHQLYLAHAAHLGQTNTVLQVFRWRLTFYLHIINIT